MNAYYVTKMSKLGDILKHGISPINDPSESIILYQTNTDARHKKKIDMNIDHSSGENQTIILTVKIPDTKINNTLRYTNHIPVESISHIDF